jgi:hypothetical protein
MRKLTIGAVSFLVSGTMLIGIAQAQQTPAANPQQAPAASATAAPTSGAQKAPTAGTGQPPAAGAQKAPAAKPGTATKPRTQVPFTLKTQKDKVSYAVGMNVGKGVVAKLHQQAVDVDQAILLRGMKDALAGGKMLLTEEEERTVLTQLTLEARKKQEEQMKMAGDVNKKVGE